MFTLGCEKPTEKKQCSVKNFILYLNFLGILVMKIWWKVSVISDEVAETIKVLTWTFPALEAPSFFYGSWDLPRNNRSKTKLYKWRKKSNFQTSGLLKGSAFRVAKLWENTQQMDCKVLKGDTCLGAPDKDCLGPCSFSTTAHSHISSSATHKPLPN